MGRSRWSNTLAIYGQKMLMLKLISKTDNGGLHFRSHNEKGESKDFWPIGTSAGCLDLFEVMPITSSSFDIGKNYQITFKECK